MEKNEVCGTGKKLPRGVVYEVEERPEERRIYTTEKKLPRGVVYEVEEKSEERRIYTTEKKLPKGVVYDAEEKSGERVIFDTGKTLVRGVTYDLPEKISEDISCTKMKKILEADTQLQIISSDHTSISTASIVEEVPKLPSGIFTIPPNFVTRPERTGAMNSTAFSGGNFKLILCRIDHYMLDGLDGEVDEKFYIFEVATDSQMFEGSVKYTDIEDPKWIREISQGEAYLFPEKEAKRQFIYYVHALLETSNVPEEWIYESTGWRKLRDGKYYFIDSTGVIGHPEIPACCKENFHIIKEEFPVQENYIRETLGMIDICFDKKISSMLFLYNHVGMLTTLFKLANFPVRFIMGCIGISNSKKTSLSSLMTQLFNRDVIKPEISFTSTEGGIETAMAQYGDAVLLIDDFMPGASRQKQNQLQNKLELILRAYGDRIAKRRMTDFCKTDTKVSYPVRGCCLITGEQISGTYSSMSRIIVLSQTAKDVDVERLSYYQRKPHLMSKYVYDFLSYVTENFEFLIDYMKENCFEIRNRQLFKVPRFSEVYAVFAISVDIILMFLESTLKFSEAEQENLKILFREIIVSVLRENEHRLVGQNMPTIILETIRDNLLNNANCVKKSLYKGGQDAVPYDESFVYVKLEILYLWVKEYIKKYDCTVALSDKRHLLTYLKEMRVIETKRLPNGKTESTRKIVGLPQNHERYLYLDWRKIKEKIDEIG